MPRSSLRNALPALAVLLVPRSVLACAVCMGAGDDPNIGRAYFWALLTMIGAAMLGLAGLGWFVWKIESGRARGAAEAA